MNSVSQLLSAGLNVTIIGMGVVFVLLTLLVGIVHLMSAFSQLFSAAVPDAVLMSDIDPELVSAISAAIHRYRRSHFQNK